jgi:hypothetical protein
MIFSHRSLVVVVLLVSLSTSRAIAARAQQSSPSTRTTLVILGVDHSAQLGAPAYHPGYFRVFFDRVKAAAICIERSPDEFARGDYYEFTYEAQHIAVPYARAHGLDICPIDWLPSRDDERLAFGRIEVVDPPPVRQPTGFQGFLMLDSASLRRTIFYADSDQTRGETRSFFDGPRVTGWRDFPRRLDLYRTFMQAMRIRAAVRAHAGQTVLVVIGSMHKEDIERVLGEDPGILLVQPSTYGPISAAQADAQLDQKHLAAILSFNLLGVQPSVGRVDWRWVGTVLDRYAGAYPRSAELPLLRARYDVLTGRLPSAAAALTNERLAAAADSGARFTFTGVEDARRIDSYYDPFGHLSVRERALVEAAREYATGGRADRVEQLKADIIRGRTWTLLARAEFDVYWSRYITRK